MVRTLARAFVPMNALSRTIEIDLRQLLGETDVPRKEQVVDDILY